MYEVEKKYRYISFVLIAEKRKTKVWSCVNNRSHGTLGEVKWYSPWRRYCFFPREYRLTVFDHNCLTDIGDFLDHVTKERRNG